MRRLSRRTLLRGVAAGSAVALALPPLEAMLDDNGALADGNDLGPIFGVFFWANGTPWHAGHGAEQAQGNYPDQWTPTTMGQGYTPSPLLAPLAGHGVSVISGLEPHTIVPGSPGGQSDGHMRGFMVSLTSDRPRSDGFDHASHTLTALRPSLDQYIAKHDDFYGNELPRYRSVALGVSPARFHEYGHWNAVSYNGPDSTNLPVSDAGQLYDLLFAAPPDADALTRRASLIDAVLEDAKHLKGRLGAADKLRVEAHIEHLNEIQRRLELGVAVCDAPVPQPGSSGDLHQQTSALGELLALALGCGLTRVFSFMLTSPATTHIFGNLNVADGMHKACHDGDWQDVYNITEYQMQGFARLLDELAAVTDPTGSTLMDRALIYGCSEYGEGWKHGVKEMPVVLAGSACGRIQTNTHVRDAGGNMSKAHVTMLRALGITTPSYGFNGGETADDFAGLLI
jgi:hypothetical protein